MSRYTATAPLRWPSWSTDTAVLLSCLIHGTPPENWPRPYRRAAAAHIAQVGADAATTLGHAGDIGVGVADALRTCRPPPMKQLDSCPPTAGIGQGRGVATVMYRLDPSTPRRPAACGVRAAFLLHQVQRDGQPALLRQFVDLAAAIAGQVARGQQYRPLYANRRSRSGRSSPALQLFLRIAAQDVVAVDAAVSQAFLQAHIRTVLQADVVEAVAAGALYRRRR